VFCLYSEVTFIDAHSGLTYVLSVSVSNIAVIHCGCVGDIVISILSDEECSGTISCIFGIFGRGR